MAIYCTIVVATFFDSYGKVGKFTKQLWNIRIEICAFFVQEPSGFSSEPYILHLSL